MALMTSMREKMHVVLWALLFMFLLSMTIGGLVGGANILDQLIGRVNPQTTIAQINEINISPDRFNSLVNQQVESARSSGRPINDFVLQRARKTAWDNLIQDVLVSQEVKRLNISATNEEVIYHLRNNPPPFLQQNPNFQTDNKFDITKYRQALANPQGDEWAPIESFMRETYIPNFKLQKMVDESIIITNSEIKNEFLKRNIKYTVSSIHVTSAKVQKDVLEPSDDDIDNKYSELKEDFKHDELRSINYVSWAKQPSKQDSLNTKNLANELYARAKSGEDFSSLANEYSMDPGNLGTKGGDLGWFKKGQMVKEFEEAAFSSKKNNIIKPITSNFGVHVIYVKDFRVNKTDEKEVSASHILLKIEPSSTTLSNLKRDATLFSYDAQDNGFDKTLSEYNYKAEIVDNLNIEDYSLKGIGGLRSAVSFAFNNKIGDISDIIENDDYFVICQLKSITPPGYKLIDDVRDNLIKNIKQDRLKQLTLDNANDILIDITGTNLTLDKMLTPEKGIELIKEDIKTLSEGFTSIGKNDRITGAVLNGKIGDLIGPLETRNGHAIIQINDISTFDSTEFEVQLELIRGSIFNKKQNNYFQAWLNDLKESAKIIDNRRYYF